MTYGVHRWRENELPRPGVLRRFIIPAILLLFFYYVALLAQHVARLIVAQLAKATTIAVDLGVGRLRTHVEIAGEDFGLCEQWWWGPRVSAAGGMGEVGSTVFNAIGPVVGAIIIGFMLWDTRRGKNFLAAIVIAANLAAIATTVIVDLLGR